MNLPQNVPILTRWRISCSQLCRLLQEIINLHHKVLQLDFDWSIHQSWCRLIYLFFVTLDWIKVTRRSLKYSSVCRVDRIGPLSGSGPLRASTPHKPCVFSIDRRSPHCTSSVVCVDIGVLTIFNQMWSQFKLYKNCDGLSGGVLRKVLKKVLHGSCPSY